MALESGGDPQALTYIMGSRHKVRSFYNSIIAPWSEAGDAVVDTHQVAASLMQPWGLRDAPVLHNFGPSPSAA